MKDRDIINLSQNVSINIAHLSSPGLLEPSEDKKGPGRVRRKGLIGPRRFSIQQVGFHGRKELLLRSSKDRPDEDLEKGLSRPVSKIGQAGDAKISPMEGEWKVC